MVIRFPKTTALSFACLIGFALPLNEAKCNSSPSSELNRMKRALLHYAEQGGPLPELFDVRSDSPAKLKQLQNIAQLCGDTTLPAEARYACVLSATHSGGAGSIDIVIEAIEDPSWLVRVAALRSTRVLATSLRLPSSLHQKIQKRTQDPALAVRREALESLTLLPSEISLTELKAAVEEPRNYHAGRPLWVPQRALHLLKGYSDPSTREWLRAFSQRTPHPELKRIATGG